MKQLKSRAFTDCGEYTSIPALSQEIKKIIKLI